MYMFDLNMELCSIKRSDGTVAFFFVGKTPASLTNELYKLSPQKQKQDHQPTKS